MRQGDGMEKIRITAPTPWTCRECATEHDPRDPHDRDSLYYQQRFYKRHKRFPTWKDAMAHCGPLTQMAWREELARRGIKVEDAGDEP